MEFASSPHDFMLMLASAGRRASDLSQVPDAAGDAAALLTHAYGSRPAG